ncbi:MAG: formylglycine-generating enzyme family protein [Pseudonocardiaceae bacterium]
MAVDRPPGCTSGLGQGRRSPRLSPHLSGSGPDAVDAIVPAARARPSVNPCALSWVLLDTGDSGLWWSCTPVTCAHTGRPGGDLPVVGLTWMQAHAVAEAVGGRLPTAPEWEWMAAGHPGRRFPWGEQDWTPRHANLRGTGYGHPVAVGRFADGATPDGILDVAGNVWEWTATRRPGDGAVVLGGSYNSLPRYAQCGYRNEVPVALASPGLGLRVVRDP